jgi:DNA-binding NarL/FixJ family response regulator
VIDDHEVFTRGIVACLREDPLLAVTEFNGTLPGPGAVDVLVISGKVGRAKLSSPAVVCYARPADAARLAARPDVLAVLPRRTVTPDQLIAAVRAAAAGLKVNGEPQVDAGLSERSRDILRMLAGGADTREISSKLGYSERTIKAAIAEVQRALGARNRAHAVAEAVKANLI